MKTYVYNVNIGQGKYLNGLYNFSTHIPNHRYTLQCT